MALVTKEKLLSLVKKQSHLDAKVIARAYDVAARAHVKQKRDGGAPYITHPAAVAATLLEIGMDTPTIAAALLHDVIEDTPVTLEEIRGEFGDEIAFFVEGVTKLEKIPTGNPDGQLQGPGGSYGADAIARIETLRKMFLATAQDIRVALIKLADRLHNMQTLPGCEVEKRLRVSQETMDIYAPLAGRLGMGEWKGRLEDFAFPHLYPKEYEWLVKQVGKAYRERQMYIKKIVPVVQKMLQEENVEPLELEARPKHHWSLYQKLLAHDMDLDKIHDLVALRVIVKNVEDCYKALGVLHKHFKPLPGRIKDYIAIPKGSGYQSLHTTVFCVDGRITEFQIRTQQMHEEAELGIAAHWRYKDHRQRQKPSGRAASGLDKKTRWVEQIQEWQKAARGSKEFLDALKLDFLKTHIFVFTPKGDIIDLPSGACAIDFAYAIHSEIGHRCAGAKVDGRIVPLAHSLTGGSLVEIITRKDPKPNRDWLSIVKTTEARKKITAWFNRKDAREIPKNETEDMPSAGESLRVPKLQNAARTGTVIAEGMKGVLTHLAKCCVPLPGDAIEGYVTLQNGIAIHKSSCANLGRLRQQRKRIPVSWDVAKGASYPATIRVQSATRIGLLKDIAEVISKAGLNILSITAFDTPEGKAVEVITLEVASVDELSRVIKNIKDVKNVFEVERT